MPRSVRRRRRGAGIGDFLKKAHRAIKSGKLISKGAQLLGASGVPYAPQVGAIASSLGYGRRRRYGRRKRRYQFSY